MLPESRRLTQLLNTETPVFEQGRDPRVTDQVQRADNDQVVAIVVEPAGDRVSPPAISICYQDFAELYLFLH